MRGVLPDETWEQPLHEPLASAFSNVPAITLNSSMRALIPRTYSRSLPHRAYKSAPGTSRPNTGAPSVSNAYFGSRAWTMRNLSGDHMRKAFPPSHTPTSKTRQPPTFFCHRFGSGLQIPEHRRIVPGRELRPSSFEFHRRGQCADARLPPSATDLERPSGSRGTAGPHKLSEGARTRISRVAD